MKIANFRLPQKIRSNWGLYDCWARAWYLTPNNGYSSSSVRTIKNSVIIDLGRQSAAAKAFRESVFVIKLGEEAATQTAWDRTHRNTCPTCKGTGRRQLPPAYPRFHTADSIADCSHCQGTGKKP